MSGLRFRAYGALNLARAFLAARANESPGTLRLTVPILPEGLLAGALAGVLDRVGDVVLGKVVEGRCSWRPATPRAQEPRAPPVKT